MIARGLVIALALAAAVGLWFAYAELNVLRGTSFWDYRYVIFGAGAFLALSLLEALVGWIKARFTSGDGGH